MKNHDQSRVFDLADYERQDFSVCLGCKICASVCTVNDLAETANPQEILQQLFLGKNISVTDPLVRYCTGCYRCTDACPWNIRIPEVIRALREELGAASPFERTFKQSVSIWGRVYEPYVIIKAISFLLRGGYLKHLFRWREYVGLHLPHNVKRT